MKKKIAATLISAALALSLAGCGGVRDVVNQLSADVDKDNPASIHKDPEADSAKVYAPDYSYPFDEFPSAPGSLITPELSDANTIFIAVDDAICYSGNFDEIVKHCGLEPTEDEWCGPVLYDCGALIVKCSGYANDTYNEKIIALYPQNGEYSEIANFNSYVNIPVYEDNLYIADQSYDNLTSKTNYTEYTYSRDNSSHRYTYVNTSYAELSSFMTDNFVTYYIPTKPSDHTIMSLAEVMDTIGFVIVGENNRYHRLYPDMHIEFMAELDYGSYLTSYDANFAVIDHNNYGSSNYTDILDMSTNRIESLDNDYFAYLAYQNGCVYYSKSDYDSTGKYYDIYMYNCWDKVTSKLYSTRHAAGATTHYFPGISTFRIVNNIIYTMNYNDETTNWYAAKASEDGYNFYDTGYQLIVYPWKEFGEIVAYEKEDYCPHCGIVNFTYYSEGFVPDSSIGCRDKIISKLTEIEDKRSKSWTLNEYVLSEEHCSEFHAEDTNIVSDTFTIDFHINDVKLISSHFLGIYEDGYEYSGGAHGYPYYSQQLFDLNTGDYIEFANIYNGTEAHLKDVVATAAMEDHNRKSEENGGYSDYFGESAKEVYMDVSDYTTINTLLGTFEDDGYHVLFPPYAVGPYASGYIEVVVSYEDLGITLF